mmetsp:Transcript_30860/g.61178  ORF Transcript_30860/g.61178 Transcript_30860/m.61178 type:complete len:410 (+) Transcript_30860:53-1282(+)
MASIRIDVGLSGEAMEALTLFSARCGTSAASSLVLNAIKAGEEQVGANIPPPQQPAPSHPLPRRGQVAPGGSGTTARGARGQPRVARGTRSKIERSIMEAAMAAGGGNANLREDSKRVGLAIIEPFVIDTRHTLGQVVLGAAGSRAAFSLLKGSKGVLIASLSTIGLLVSTLALFGAIPSVLSYAIFGAVPAWLAVFSSLNLELLGQLLTDFDCLVLLFYATLIFIPLALSFDDERVLLALHVIGFYYIILTDAAPERVRNLWTRVATMSGWMLAFALAVALFFEKIPDMTLREVTVGKTVYTTADISFISSLQLLLFLSNQLWSAIFRPSCFCLVRSRMKSVKTDKKSADILTSFHDRLHIAGPSTVVNTIETPHLSASLQALKKAASTRSTINGKGSSTEGRRARVT